MHKEIDIDNKLLSGRAQEVFKAKTGLAVPPDWAWAKVLRPDQVDDYYF
jgi:hypothetical protein